MIKHILAAISLCCITGTCLAASIASDLINLADNHNVKVVWSRGGGGEFGFAARYVTDQCLMKFDTKTGKEDTVCWADADPKKSNVTRPIISHDGTKILFSNAVDSSVWIINWDGTGKRHIAKGIAGCLWYDSASKKEYAIYAKNASLECLAPVWRVNINDTSDTKEVLPKSVIAATTNQVINPIWIGVSKDGTGMVCGTGWPAIAEYSLVTQKPINAAGGCWPSTPYDNSYTLVVFTLDHDAFNIYPAGTTKNTFLTPICPWKNDTCRENQLNFPKMSSNHRQFMSLIDARSESSGQGPGSIMVFKFDTSLTKFLGSAVVTSSKRDGFSDVWIGDETSINSHDNKNNMSSSIPTFSLSLSNANRTEAILTLNNSASVEITVFTLSGQLTMHIKGQYAEGMHRFALSSKNRNTGTTYLANVKVNNAIVKNFVLPAFN